MDIDLSSWLRSIEAGFGRVPGALIAIVLLAGPTAIWLLYRYVVQPRTSRYRATVGGAMWICPACRSVNELRIANCYRCDRVPNEADLRVIDPDLDSPFPMGLPTATSVGVAVGPGRSDLTSLPGLTGLAGVRGVTATESRPATTDGRQPSAVGPGRARAARPTRVVAAGRTRAKPSDPDGRPAA